MKSAAPRVSVIIVSWNGRSWLTHCLPTLQQQTFADFEIIVVDNGSIDGTVPWLQENWPQVRVIPLKINLGFAPANNIGIRLAQGDYIVTLNNDTLVDKNFLAELITAVSSPNIGMVAPRITMWNHPHKLDSAGIEVDWLGTAWQRGSTQSAHIAYPTTVFGPSAAAALYRREMLAEIGLFAEQFFAYYEDVDLAWRGRQAGWRCVYAPQARVAHWHSATSAKNPAYKAYLLGRNKIWCFLKNYPAPQIFFILPLFLLYDSAAALVQMIRLHSLAPLQGRLQGWLAGRHFWRKRKNKAQSIRFAQPAWLTRLSQPQTRHDSDISAN